MLKESTVDKINKIKTELDKLNILYTEKPNGQLIIDSINLYATTEKWNDLKNNKSGQGFNSFLKYFKELI